MSIQGKSWNLSDEYSSTDCDEILSDIETVRACIEDIEKENSIIEEYVENPNELKESNTQVIDALQKIFLAKKKSAALIGNIATYSHCILSVNVKDSNAKKLSSEVMKIYAELEEKSNPFNLVLAKMPDDVKLKYLDHEQVSPSAFSLDRYRSVADYNLSLPEENLITSLDQNGLSAWGKLYGNLSGSIQVKLEGEDKKIGLATASAYLKSSDEKLRERAYKAIENGWTEHQETCAAILNAQIGWRLDLDKKRAVKKEKDFLTDALQVNRITKKTLDAMMGAVKKKRDTGIRALKLQASLLGKKQLSPWDLLADCPKVAGESKKYSYEDGLSLVADAYGSVNPDMKSFVNIMDENEWVEGTVGDYKRTGAYCTKFAKSRNPRVYMTYQGSAGDVSTLAHELGHAFHNWKLKDMPIEKARYPMTLAETASIFGETVVGNYLVENATTLQDKLSVAWDNALSAAAFLINIPARYFFEKSMYEERSKGDLTPEKITELNKNAWEDIYGDSITEVNSTFWQSKLHFYISGLTFYNFPYTFGYLFALGVYAQKDKLGVDFYDSYVSLLKDTGSMTSEEVAKKHLGVDIEDEKFWIESIEIVDKQLDNFESLLSEIK